MDTLKQSFSEIGDSLGDTLPAILGGLGILLLGWIVAVVARAAVRKLLGKLQVNNRVQAEEGESLDLESLIAKIVFWVIIVMALVGFFSALNLTAVSSPLQGMVDKVLGFLPNLIAGVVIGLLAWGIAQLGKYLVEKGLGATTLDEKLAAGADMQPMSANLAQVAYWLILLLFLPAILGVLQLDGLLQPVRDMVNTMLGMLPNIFAALVLGIAGWFVARILRDLVVNLLQAVGFDQLGEKAGFTESLNLSKLVGTLVFVFVFVPALIAALNALRIEAISGPATDMLSAMMRAIPDIFAAVIILGVAIIVARFVANILRTLLASAGADDVPGRMGLETLSESGFRLSDFVARVAQIFLILFATVEAANQLGFEGVSNTVAMFIEFAGSVLLGVVILSVGFWLAGVAHTAILRISGAEAANVANIARYAILLLVAAMGLRAMGIADDIVNTAFTLVLGAVAVAFALSFGLGGREAAGRQMEYWLSRMRDRGQD